MLKIGLTGNRFSGKNTIAKQFKAIGVPVFDADVILKFIINYNNQVFISLQKEFGDDISNLGLIDSHKFNNDEKMNRLFDIVEYDMWEAYNRWVLKHSLQPYIIFKSSIIFERDLKNNFDKIINVFCPSKVRADRYAQSSQAGLNKWSVLEVMKQEMDEYTKNELSDFIIHNYDEISPLVNQIKHIHTDILDISNKNKKQLTT